MTLHAQTTLWSKNFPLFDFQIIVENLAFTDHNLILHVHVLL